MVKKHPTLAQALSTILLVILRGCVRLFVPLSFINIYSDCFFLIEEVGSFC